MDESEKKSWRWCGAIILGMNAGDPFFETDLPSLDLEKVPELIRIRKLTYVRILPHPSLKDQNIVVPSRWFPLADAKYGEKDELTTVLLSSRIVVLTEVDRDFTSSLNKFWMPPDLIEIASQGEAKREAEKHEQRIREMGRTPEEAAQEGRKQGRLRIT